MGFLTQILNGEERWMAIIVYNDIFNLSARSNIFCGVYQANNHNKTHRFCKMCSFSMYTYHVFSSRSLVERCQCGANIVVYHCESSCCVCELLA